MTVASALRAWWCEQARDLGAIRAFRLLAQHLWRFALESTPSQRRQRYGDMEYDWDHRVNTTSGTTDWRTRLLGLFHSPYQPTEPGLFGEMIGALPIHFDQFTFIDLGSGKGRTLLMAGDYPFRKIIGVELLPELHRAAVDNIREYRNPAQRCSTIDLIMADARDYRFPEEPIVLYLFNPLPVNALSKVLQHLQESLARSPRPVWIVYHNPLLDTILGAADFLERVGGTAQYAVYRSNAVV